MRILVILGLCVGIIGCSTVSNLPAKPFTQPQYGMSKQEMTDLLGKPETIEIYKKPDQTRVEYYFYFRDYPYSQEKVPVCLIDNKVVGWGKTYYADHVNGDDTRIK